MPPLTAPPATSGRFCRLQNHKRMIGIFLNRGFLATYLANAKNDAENHPEVRFQRENEGQNLRNGPEVDRRRQSAPDIARAKRAVEMLARSARERTSVPCSRGASATQATTERPRRAGYSKNLATPTGMHWRMRPTNSTSSKSMPRSNQWRVQPAQPFEKKSRQNPVSP